MCLTQSPFPRHILVFEDILHFLEGISCKSHIQYPSTVRWSTTYHIKYILTSFWVCCTFMWWMNNFWIRRPPAGVGKGPVGGSFMLGFIGILVIVGRSIFRIHASRWAMRMMFGPSPHPPLPPIGSISSSFPGRLVVCIASTYRISKSARLHSSCTRSILPSTLLVYVHRESEKIEMREFLQNRT